jgi:chemotaxis signal transduction protein
MYDRVNAERKNSMEQKQTLIFIVYLLNQHEHTDEMRCLGCREIVIPEYKTPTHIRGMIEFERELIPVIDPSLYFLNKPTQVTNATCILVIQHSHGCRSRRTGVLIENDEEILNLAAGSYKTAVVKPSTFNMRFVLEIYNNFTGNILLSNTHVAFDLYEQKKQADADFAAFRVIVSGSLNACRSNRVQPLKRYPTPRMVSI